MRFQFGLIVVIVGNSIRLHRWDSVAGCGRNDRSSLRAATVCGLNQAMHRSLPFLCVMLGFRKFGDIGDGIAQCLQLDAARRARGERGDAGLAKEKRGSRLGPQRISVN